MYRTCPDLSVADLELLLGTLAKGGWLTAEEIKDQAFPVVDGRERISKGKVIRVLVGYRDRGTIRSRNRTYGLVEWSFTEEGLRRWNAGLRGKALTTNAYAKDMIVTRMEGND